MLLSLSFLATAVKVDASPSLNFGSTASTSSYVPQSPQQQPKKKPILKRAAHKVAKRLGFSGSTPNSEADASTNSQTTVLRNYKQPEITLEELKELYASEYGETMETTKSRDDNGLAETLKRTLALRERALEARRADNSFAAESAMDSSSEEESIYSKPIDTISISSSTTQYSEPWQDPDEEIARVLGTEFRSNNQIKPTAPPLSAFSTVSTNKGLENTSSNILDHSVGVIEIGGIKINGELLDRAYQDSKERDDTKSIGSIDRDEAERDISESEMDAELQEQIEELKRRGQYKEPEVIGEHGEKSPDARYERVTATEEARQTMSRIPSKVSEMRAIMEEKYAATAGDRVSQTNQQSLDRKGTSLDSAVKETGVVEPIIDDSGYSSPSSHGQESRSKSRASSPSIIDSRAESPIKAQTFEDKAITEDTASHLDIAALNDQLSQDENYSSTSTSSYEYDTDAEIRTYENVPMHSKKKKLKTRRQRREASRYSYRDIEQELAGLDDSEFSDEDDDEWNKTKNDATSDTDGYDTVYTSSSEYFNDSGDEDDVPLPLPPTAEELVELDKISEVSNPEQTLVTPTDVKSSEFQEDGITASDLETLDHVNEEDSLSKEILTNSGTIAVTELQDQQTPADSTITSKEELLKKATIAAASHNQARNMSKISRNHIKHRIFAREVLTAAVAAGDDDAEKASDYSIWSSGTLGSNKQKSKADSHGYSSKITGGTIGLELNLEHNALVGSSFSKFSSRVKHHDQDESSDVQTSGKSTRAKYDTQILSLYGLSPVSRNMSMSAIGAAGLSKCAKSHSKLLSLESHLNYKIALPQNITLIPHIGLRYEYEKAKCYQEQIASNLSVERSKKSYQALSGEIGSRAIFAPINLKDSTPRAISITPTTHFSVERRIGSRGASSPYHLTYQGSSGGSGEIGASTLSINPQHQKTSFNAGIGLIASHKNIKLELLYDHTRQKRFKAHQGMLKLKVSL
ncbi:autotransporter outer membrane beta-barrel domain-containing protein [Rickettsia endosymbiont of Pantilius tunicatus]|uniref:autotransporter outer membrane beta-barrel domain-containing protein n=1 Tax=Rickettsia endosymbiont of Pantilius tunicatus TaxID=3066267 RepID=UPI00376F06B3